MSEIIDLHDTELRQGLYSIIPSFVRYNKELSPSAILMYGEITALCNEKGYCWATNEYFANLYLVSIKSVSRWLKQLSDCKHIALTYHRFSNGSNAEMRRISILSNVQGGGQKCPEPLDKSVPTPIDKNVPENNINYRNNYLYRESTHAQNIDSQMSMPPTQKCGQEPSLDKAVEIKDKFVFGKYKNVRLTDAEHSKLTAEERGEEAIEFLSEYIEMKGYKAKSHYLAIKKWVYSAIKEKEIKERETAFREQRAKGGGYNGQGVSPGMTGKTSYDGLLK